jgi:hypothetical protein
VIAPQGLRERREPVAALRIRLEHADAGERAQHARERAGVCTDPLISIKTGCGAGFWLARRTGFLRRAPGIGFLEGRTA